MALEGDHNRSGPPPSQAPASTALQNSSPARRSLTAHVLLRPALPRFLDPCDALCSLLPFHSECLSMRSTVGPRRKQTERGKDGRACLQPSHQPQVDLQVELNVGGDRRQHDAGEARKKIEDEFDKAKARIAEQDRRVLGSCGRKDWDDGGTPAPSQLQADGSESSGATLSDHECSSSREQEDEVEGEREGEDDDEDDPRFGDEVNEDDGPLSYEDGNHETEDEDHPPRTWPPYLQLKRRRHCLPTSTSAQARIPSVNSMPTASSAYCQESMDKKSKQVQFQLDPLTHQKFLKLLMDQHEGSFQRFVVASINAIETHSMCEQKLAMRRPALSKWKRTRFDQLKGTETQELALAFKLLAESTSGVKVTLELMETPWQHLNMAQIEKMLEETKKMLSVHEKVHDCPYENCGRRFSTPGNLRDHLNEHSGAQPYSCTVENCSYRFRSKQLLCRHLKKHERAHRCTFEGCNKRFAFRERLIVHQKTHSDERPLSCPWEGCGKTFKWANSLHGHLRTHTGEKPFQCTFAGCGRFFGYKVDLTRHRRTHFGQPARSSH